MSLAEFDREFAAKLGRDHRWPAFKTIAYYLLAKRAPIGILETGCAREVENWCGDGQSTRVWDWLLERCGGFGVSFDINPTAVAYAQSKVKKMEVRCVDSVIGLRQFQMTELLDFVYLDSFDLSDGIESPTHHLAELTAIYPRLKSGCLIAVDDCKSAEHGKHRFVRDWLASLGVPPLFESYVTIWRKP